MKKKGVRRRVRRNSWVRRHEEGGAREADGKGWVRAGEERGKGEG